MLLRWWQLCVWPSTLLGDCLLLRQSEPQWLCDARLAPGGNPMCYSVGRCSLRPVTLLRNFLLLLQTESLLLCDAGWATGLAPGGKPMSYSVGKSPVWPGNLLGDCIPLRQIESVRLCDAGREIVRNPTCHSVMCDAGRVIVRNPTCHSVGRCAVWPGTLLGGICCRVCKWRVPHYMAMPVQHYANLGCYTDIPHLTGLHRPSNRMQVNVLPTP